MIVEFTKMHGIGNDFVVINAITQQIQLNPLDYSHIADRRFGIGCDQILLVESPKEDNIDFHYRIFNADGSEVAACGNGARCFARYVKEKGLSDKRSLRVATSAGVITLTHIDDNLIEVDMGVPRFEPSEIPFSASQRSSEYSLCVEDSEQTISAVSMGNPHAVLLVPDVDLAPVERLGPLIEHHKRFPERTNVGFMQVLNRGEIRLRVFERGTGETLACGSGACAAVAAGRQLGLLDKEVVTHLRGGDLVIKWPSEGQSVLMRGPAQTVYEGSIEI